MEGLPCQVQICAMNVPGLTLGFGGPRTRSKLFSPLSDFNQIAAIKMLIFPAWHHDVDVGGRSYLRKRGSHHSELRSRGVPQTWRVCWFRRNSTWRNSLVFVFGQTEIGFRSLEPTLGSTGHCPSCCSREVPLVHRSHL